MAGFASYTLLSSRRTDAASVRLVSAGLSVVLLGGAAVLYQRRAPRGRRAVTSDRVEHDSMAIRHTRADGRVESLQWTDLRGVDILTTSDGPWAEDVFLVLLGPDSKPACLIPQGSDGFASLLKQLGTLPAFDDHAVITAMGSTSDARFPCWRPAPTV